MKTEEKLHNQLNSNLFEKIIKGNFRPYREYTDDKCKTDDLWKTAQQLTLIYNYDIISEFKSRNKDMTKYGFLKPTHYTFDIKKLGNSKFWVQIKPTEIYELREEIDVEFLQTGRIKLFTSLIIDEYERCKIRATHFFNSTNDPIELETYAKKNIQITKNQFDDVQVLIPALIKNNNFESAYIIGVLGFFIIRKLKFVSNLFLSFYKAEMASPEELNIKLYKLAFAGAKEFSKFYLQSEGTFLKDWGLLGIHPSYTHNNQDLGKSCTGLHCLFDQIQEYDDPNEDDNNLVIKEKIKWNGQINALVDLFQQFIQELKVNGNPLIESPLEVLGDFFITNFKDRKGKNLSKQTIMTLLKPSRSDKRIHPESPNRIIANFNK